MKSRTTITYAVGLATAATLALAGCNGGDEAPTPSLTSSATSTGSPSSSPSASPTRSASPTASASTSIAIPAAARANTDAGAIAFVNFWFEQVNVAFTQPDPTLIPALSAPDCKSCANLAENPAEFAAKGHRAKPGPFKPLTNVKSLGRDPEGQYRVGFTLAQNAVSVVDASGKVLDTQKAESAERVALISRKGERWIMKGLAAPRS